MIIKSGKKTYIPNVKRMSWDTGEMCEFASAFIRAAECMGYAGERACDYDFIAGVSGAAFRFVMDENIWNPRNYGILNFFRDRLMPIKNASLTLGRKACYVESSYFQADKEIITACISEGKPVIAFGVIGPSDAVILTGYDEDGDVLLGWSTFQDISDDHNEPHDSSGYFRKSAWHGNLKGYVIFGSEKHTTDLKAITVRALKYIPEIINTPFLSGRICGLKALAEWRNAILNDNNFNTDAELLKWRYLCFTINTTMLLDQLSAPIFLDSASAYIPEFTETLKAAALLYRKNSETIIEARQLIADDFSPSAQERFINREIRVKYAGLMDDIYKRTSEASALIKSCAEKLN